MKKPTASLSRNQGRESWSIIFRHPIRKDARGKYGLRIRRGLGTVDMVEAERLVAQMNTILADESMWDLGAREKASVNFDSRIVAAFYDDISPMVVNPRDIRNNAIPLPGPEEGYSRALIIGTTGAGKTTLLRQLMGTYSKRDRFPSTSAGRTTTCDIEVVCSDDSCFSTVITFMTRNEARFYIEECVQAAIQTKLFSNDPKSITESFLVHRDQRFRLSYILGHPSIINIKSHENNSEEDWDDENDDDEDDIDDGLNQSERKSLVQKLQGYLKRVQEMGESAAEAVSYELGLQVKDLTSEEKEIVNELVLETYLEQSNEFHEFVDDILDEVQNRFSQLENGEVICDTQGWVNGWAFSNEDRAEFLRTVRKFSSNHVQQWGSLLTPLVEGIRVKGPFLPSSFNEVPKIVLIDGEGLGHTADSAISLPTRITRQFDSVQSIILVDNGASPMLAASQAVLKAVVASGHIRKMILCFTHMDAVKGDNMKKGSEKVNHVKASIGVTLKQLQETYSYAMIASMERNFNERSTFFWNLHEKLGEGGSSASQLERLVDIIKLSIIPPPIPEACAKYESIYLFVSMQNAVKRFHEKWDTSLGLRRAPGKTAEHWSRIKALSKRLAYTSQDHYDNLAPIADLISLMSEHLGIFLGKPYVWEPSGFPDDSKFEVIDAIKQDVFSKLHVLAAYIIWQDLLNSWISAYERRGRGSAVERARDIQRIFQMSTPIYGETPGESDNEHKFLQNISKMVEESMNKYNCQLTSFGQ